MHVLPLNRPELEGAAWAGEWMRAVLVRPRERLKALKPSRTLHLCVECPTWMMRQATNSESIV